MLLSSILRLQTMEWGRLPFMLEAEFSRLQGVHPKELDPCCRTSSSEPGFDCRPEHSDKFSSFCYSGPWWRSNYNPKGPYILLWNYVPKTKI